MNDSVNPELTGEPEVERTAQYTGTKTVTAIAMTRGAYNNYREWDLPADEDGTDEGYLVEYLDGGEANHAAHAGYISWSPKEQFDNAYDLSGTAEDRVRIELEDLMVRVNNLLTFQTTEKYKAMSKNSQRDLRMQLGAMKEYAAILTKRIQVWAD